MNKKGYKSPTQRKGDGLKTNYIVNSLPYIRRLEHGHSKQARNPNGMLRVTINELRYRMKCNNVVPLRAQKMRKP